MRARHLQIADSKGAKAGFNFWREQLLKFGHDLPEGNKRAQFDWYCANKLNDAPEPKGIQVVASAKRTAKRVTRRRKANTLSIGDVISYERKDGSEVEYEVTGEGKTEKYNKPGLELTNIETGRAKVWNAKTIGIYLDSGRITRL